MDKLGSCLHNPRLVQLVLMVLVGLSIACTSLSVLTPLGQSASIERSLTPITDDPDGVSRPQMMGTEAYDLPALSKTALPVATSNIYYVSRTGSNGDGQSWATAWNELDQIDWSVVQPGDTIQIDGGGTECSFPFEITGTLNTPPDPSCGMIYESTLTIAQSGSASAPITVSLSNESGRNGTVRIFGGRSNLLPYCAQPNYIYQTDGVRTIGIDFHENASHIIIDGSKWRGIVVYGHNAHGIRLYKEYCVADAPVPTDITIRNVEIFDNGYARETNGLWYADGNGVDLAGTNVTFERVIIHDNGQDEFQSAGGIQDITVKRSWLYNSRPLPGFPGEAWNGPCTHSDGIQIFGGGDQYGLTVQDSIVGPGFRQALQLGSVGECTTGMIHDVTILNTLIVGHHGSENHAGLHTSTQFVTPPYHYVLDRVTSVRDVGNDAWNTRVAGSGHVVRNSVFVGGVALWVDGGPAVSNNYWWQLRDASGIGAEADPMFADSDFAGVGEGFADFDFTITNPALPQGIGTSMTSVARLLGDVTPPTAWISDLPAQSECSNVQLSWDGSDPAPGTGVKSFDVQVSDNGGAWTNWLLETAARNGVYAGGAYSHTLGFQVLARDREGNVGSYSAARYTSIIDTISPHVARMSTLPQFQTPPFEINWTGADACSSVTFDVEYRVGASPTWTRWLTATSDTHAIFNPESPQYGQLYNFRVRVRDEAGNSTESDPVSTRLAEYTLSGNIVNVRHEPVIWAQVTVTDGIAADSYFGRYIAYLAHDGDYDLQVARNGFGTLPPMHVLSVTHSLDRLDFVLPPYDDAIDNGDFEMTDWGSWLPGGTVMPAIVSGGHTGDRAARLGGIGGPSWLLQGLSVPEELANATLSFLVRLDNAAAGSSALTVKLAGMPISYTQVVTTADWTHVWLPIGASVGQAITLTFTVSNNPAVRLDEVSLGSAINGGSQVHLPVVFQVGMSSE